MGAVSPFCPLGQTPELKLLTKKPSDKKAVNGNVRNNFWVSLIPTLLLEDWGISVATIISQVG